TYDFGAPGQHLVTNSLAMIACAHVLGLDLAQAGAALSQVRPPKGRGERLTLSGHGISFTLLDESYNANPLSMTAALRTLGARPVTGRRIAVLTDMLELGPDGPAMHAALVDPLVEADVDQVFVAGPQMKSLWDALPATRRGGYALTAAELAPKVAEALSPGDVIMVKGSNGSRAGLIAAALLQRYRTGGEG
ncbi:MAG: UDP-N-acetylmuramoylalanyl-D-glutamyl-2, 6-diaminopimelate--D-alanyl-D-alanine ligase, partial [Caulobacteraceae bacterium]|nr:UDP-N-acetylmuramoylalanyl-D-glutamyl-2, 6-diaminopimelate--D-alanyl-D-alanine ligase [Caulobacteraceae bacterium]